jgi:hypothetical protein
MLRALLPLAVAVAIPSSCWAAGAAARDGDAAVVERVRALYASVNEAVGSGAARVSVFYTDGDGYEARRWTAATHRRRRDAAEQAPISATVYALAGAVRKVVVRIDSASGDWGNTTEYYFWPNGRTAFRFERHVTFLGVDPRAAGPYVIEKRRYMDEGGRVARELARAHSERTKQDVPLGSVQQIDPAGYSSVSELPFLGVK